MNWTRLLIALGASALATAIHAAEIVEGASAPASAVEAPSAVAPSAVAPSAVAPVGADAGDAPEVERELEAQSAEIDEVRIAEEEAGLVPLPHPEDGAAREAVRLVTES